MCDVSVWFWWSRSSTIFWGVVAEASSSCRTVCTYCLVTPRLRAIWLYVWPSVMASSILCFCASCLYLVTRVLFCFLVMRGLL